MGILAHAIGLHSALDVATVIRRLASFDREMRRMLQWLDDAPRRRHAEFLVELEIKAEIAKQSALFEIRKMFADAFPNRYYVFLVKRPRDTEPWPVVFTDRERANKYEDRFGPVVEVML